MREKYLWVWVFWNFWKKIYSLIGLICKSDFYSCIKESFSPLKNWSICLENQLDWKIATKYIEET